MLVHLFIKYYHDFIHNLLQEDVGTGFPTSSWCLYKLHLAVADKNRKKVTTSVKQSLSEPMLQIKDVLVQFIFFLIIFYFFVHS